MVSPMREKRAWPPQDRDSDGETAAAFAAAVAVVKETVVRSGEVLVSAKEDLSDHQRWLKTQTARVEADRERHDRWLQRQKGRQEALERREQRRARRRHMRQAAVQSVVDAFRTVFFAVRSALWLLAAKTVAVLNSIDSLAARGLHFVGSGVRLVAGSAWAALVATLSSLGHLLATAASRISPKIRDRAPAVGDVLAGNFGGAGAKVRDASRSAGAALAPAWRSVAARAEALAPGLSAKVRALALSLFATIAEAGQAATFYTRRGVRSVQAFLPGKSSPVEEENALSLPGQSRGFELSQMLIIAGVLLLVCGGLMLGGGLLLRAGTQQSTLVAASPEEPIAWLFEHKTLPIDERSVFVFAATPEGVRIKGFAIGGVNLSDQPVGSLGGIIKPDLKEHDLKLALNVETPGDVAGEAQPSEAETAGTTTEGTVPSQAPFKLVFAFPAGDGMTPQDVIAAYGGLMLKVHYEAGGKQRSFIQYLPTSLLQEQLGELQAEIKGS